MPKKLENRKVRKGIHLKAKNRLLDKVEAGQCAKLCVYLSHEVKQSVQKDPNYHGLCLVDTQ